VILKLPLIKEKNKDFPEIQSGRAVGNTTRMIDRFIQELFVNGKVKIQDHYEEGSNCRLNMFTFKRVVDRLRIEHSHLFFNHQIKIDASRLIIELM
jgi:hypothetical protein